MKKKLALVIAPLLAVTMLVGCGGNSSSQAGDKPAASAEAGTAADANIADTLVFAQGAEPRGLDPAFVDDGESSKVIVNVYEGLLAYAKDSTELEPCLA